MSNAASEDGSGENVKVISVRCLTPGLPCRAITGALFLYHAVLLLRRYTVVVDSRTSDVLSLRFFVHEIKKRAAVNRT
jgi:hypothetical protein